MKIVTIKGGLGNQLFEYCRYRQLLDAGHRTHLYYYRRQLKQHHGLLVSDCFDVSLPPQPLWMAPCVALIKLCRLLRIFPRLWDDSQPDCLYIDDYSQHARFITQARDVLRFRQFSLNNYHSRLFADISQSQCAIAVHVRRGDYLLPANVDNFGVCPPSYYQQAAQWCLGQQPEARLYVFSDDIAWARQQLHLPQAVFVEPQPDAPDHIELFLMSQCHGHIIANSTFSFWAAYLSPHQSSLQVYPRQWFKNPAWDKPDFLPAHWKAM